MNNHYYNLFKLKLYEYNIIRLTQKNTQSYKYRDNKVTEKRSVRQMVRIEPKYLQCACAVCSTFQLINMEKLQGLESKATVKGQTHSPFLIIHSMPEAILDLTQTPNAVKPLRL